MARSTLRGPLALEAQDPAHPLERPARALRDVSGRLAALRHPELRPLYFEERRLDRVIARCVRSDSNCIDVGAHIGSTLSTLVRLAPRGRHIAFEPLREKADWIARKFPEVDVRAIALADRAGAVDFLEDLTDSGYSGLRRAPRARTRLHRVGAETLGRAVGGPADREALTGPRVLTAFRALAPIRPTSHSFSFGAEPDAR